jgi:predicted nuclease of restriction endonuclease-like (RecB) superfamily
MSNLDKNTLPLFTELKQLIENSRQRVAVAINAEITLLYWHIGKYLHQYLLTNGRAAYGKEILPTISAELVNEYGKGFSQRNLANMIKLYEFFPEENILQTLSAKLSWSHFVELIGIPDPLQREFYYTLCTYEKWSVRQLRDKIDAMLYERTAIATQSEETIKTELQQLNPNADINPDLVFKNTYVLDFLNLPHRYSEKELEQALVENVQEFILELGSGFAFLERQKRISIDTIDYHLDLLFYHRKLRRLIAIDLKLGKFKPKHKAQMELYLRYLKKHEMQAGEESPIGLLLCSEGNTEHIELLMLDEKEIKVAQYLTELPSKEWFADKLHRAIEIAKMNTAK